MQVHECRKTNRSKIKVKKWLDTPNLKQYEKFITDWHYFLEDAGNLVTEGRGEESFRNLNLYILQNFYRKPYDAAADFYAQFEERMREAKTLLEQLS